MVTVTLNLDKNKENLLLNLENNSNISKETLINDLLNGKTTWADLEDINDVLIIEKDPNTKYLSSQEAKAYLKSLYHPH